jgi:sugar O-acyltransferase (sialic acid O-acetyltransferase NeuD family)
MNVGFLGFGELGKQLEIFVDLLYPRANKLYFDDLLCYHRSNFLPFLDYKKYSRDFQWVLAIGYLHMDKRLELISELVGSGCKLLNLIHPSSYISNSSYLSNGTVVYPMCNIDKEVFIGKGVLLNNSVTISHNSEVQDGTYISPGVILSGNVKVGKGSFIGSGSIVSNNISIGENVHIGVGSVITKDIPNNSWVIGNPQRILQKPLDIS